MASWEDILDSLDLADRGQELADGGLDNFQALMEMTKADMDRYSLADALAQTRELFQFLKDLRLEKYAEKFVEQGFSTLEDVKGMSVTDLDTCGVKPGHRNRIQLRICQHFGKTQQPSSVPSPSASMEGSSGGIADGKESLEASDPTGESTPPESGKELSTCVPQEHGEVETPSTPEEVGQVIDPGGKPALAESGKAVTPCTREDKGQVFGSAAFCPAPRDLPVSPVLTRAFSAESADEEIANLLAPPKPSESDLAKRNGLDLDCLAGVIEDSQDAVQATKGQNVILLLGSTGSGKTCFLHTLAGRKLVRQVRDVDGISQEVWEAAEPMDGFHIGHNPAKSETRHLRNFLLSDSVVVDAPGQLDTRANEIDIATSAVCHRIAEGCRALRFVVLVNCYTLRADRAGGLRRVAELVNNILPELGRESKHPRAINFFFTHVEALNVQEELTPETAYNQLYRWLDEVLDGAGEAAEGLAPLRWMRMTMQLGPARDWPRFVDVYNPQWTTTFDACKVMLFSDKKHCLSQEGRFRASSVGAILMPATQARIENMLKATRDEVRRVLKDANPEDLHKLSNMWKNIELVKEYLTSLLVVRSIRNEISQIFAERFEELAQDASALLNQFESDKEDFSELQANELWKDVQFLEGIAPLGRKSEEGQKCEERFFQKRLESSLNMSLDKLKTAFAAATDLASLPQTHHMTRWQSKITAWHCLKPDWATQMNALIQDHIEEAGSEARKSHELGVHVMVVARQENVKVIAEALGTFGDAPTIKGIYDEAYVALQKNFDRVFANALERAGSSVKQIVQSPSSAPASDFTMVGNLAKSIKESLSAWEKAENVAGETHARVVSWYQCLQGQVADWFNELLEPSREIQTNASELAAGKRQDLNRDSGVCYKNLFDTMRCLAESLPEPDRETCIKDFCDTARGELFTCLKQLTSTASQLSTQAVSGAGSSMKNLLVLLEVLQGFLWADSLDQAASSGIAIAEVLGSIKQEMKKYSDDLGLQFENLFRAFLEDSPSSRTSSQMMRIWNEFEALKTLAGFRQADDENQLKNKMENLLQQWVCRLWSQDSFDAITMPMLELERLDSWPAENLNTLFHANDELHSCLPDALPPGWKDAIKRLQTGAMETKMFFYSCVDASGNYKEKDSMLSALEKWRGQGLRSLLEKLQLGSIEEQVKKEVSQELSEVHSMILDPMQRQSAAAKLKDLELLSDLQSSAFDDAKVSLQQCRCVLTARNAEDDKVIQEALEKFNFKGFKDVLGQVPDKSADDAASRLFHQRLERVKEAVLERLTLAKQCLLQPDQFATEFRKVKEAEQEIGDYLGSFKDLDLTAEVQKISEKGKEHVQSTLVKIKAEQERKSYDTCLEHANELQILVDQWRRLDIFSKTQIDEADRAISKAKGCLENIKPLVTNFLKMARRVDEKTNPKDLVNELRQLQQGTRSDTKDAYKNAVEDLNQDLNKFVQEVVQIAKENCSSYSISALEFLKKQCDDGLRDHLPTAPGRVEEELVKLKEEVECRNGDLLAKLYSEEQIEQLKHQLDYLKSLSQPVRPTTWFNPLTQAYNYFTTSAEEEHRAKLRSSSAQREYTMLRNEVSNRVTDNMQDGLDGLGRGNFEVVGSVLSFKNLVKRHFCASSVTPSHLTLRAQNHLDRFENEVEKLFRETQGNLMVSLKNASNVRKTIADLGSFLDFLRHASSFTVQRTEFHDALRLFVERQERRLEQAVSTSAGGEAINANFDVGEAINATLDMQALSLILATRFVLYKSAMEKLLLETEAGRLSWNQLVAVQARIIDAQLGSQGEHFAVLEVLPTMPLRGSEIQLPSLQEVKQARDKKSRQYHTDKQYAPDRFQARISFSVRGEMMAKVNAAYEFLQSDVNQRGFKTQIAGLFLHKLKGLNTELQKHIKKLLDEQKYTKLKTILQDLRNIDPKVAANMGIFIDQMEESIQVRLIEEVRETKQSVRAKWQSGSLRELNEDLSKLQQISQELAAYPKIVPDNLIKDISDSVTEEIEKEGKKARMCVNSCKERKDAMAYLGQFGVHLIALGRISHHLRHFKLKAEEQISIALALCYEKKWGAEFLLQLGISLGKGKIGDPSKGDDTIAKYLLSSFSHLSQARIVMFNRETGLTQKDISQTLKEVSSWDVGANGNQTQRKIPSEMLQKGWKEYDSKFDKYLKKWLAEELTQDQLVQQVMASAAQLRAESGGQWTAGVKAKIPELLAGIFALYAIIRSGRAYSSVLANASADGDENSEAVQPEDLLIKPHSIQILTLLSLTGYGNDRTDLDNHVMQIRTGEGKSIALGGGACLLALLGYRVRCVCYSKYLSQRDEKDFSELFAELQLQNKGSERIVYSTITEYSEDRTAEKGDIRKLTQELVTTGDLKWTPRKKEAKVRPPEESSEKSSKADVLDSLIADSLGGVQVALDGDRKASKPSLMPAACSGPGTSKPSPAKTETSLVKSDTSVKVSGPSSAAAASSAASPEALPRDAGSFPTYDDSEEILLVDEVDVFFGSNFYGETHNLVSVMAMAEVEALLREIWKNRDAAANTGSFIQQVFQWKEFQVLLQKFPDFSDLVKSEVSQMCVDLKDHLETGNDYILNGSRIGYKVMDGIAYDVVKGYKTAYAYLQEASKGHLPDETVLRKALALRVPCGRFSYANLGSSPKILGVSGTIQALSDYEWKVMRQFGISSYTLVPSVYGRNNFQFLNQKSGMPITISTDDDHSFDICTQVSKNVKADRAVIVFFRDVAQVDRFIQSPDYSKIAHKEKLLPNQADWEKDAIAKKAATHQQVTVAPAIFGRGTDFCCFDERLEQAGGVHIIQAFFSEDKSEEVQIQGRTSRQGKSGTYSLVLSESEVKEFQLDPSSLRNMQPERQYQVLGDARVKKRAGFIKELEEKLDKTKAFDSQSRLYFDALLEAKAPLAKDRLKELYKKLGHSAGGAYHFVCCYDESGSMSGTPWQELVNAHSAFMRTLQSHSSAKVSIVQFGSSARTVLQLADVAQAMERSLSFGSSTSTNFGPPLNEAHRLMRAGVQQFPSLTPVLLFMSDGVSDDGACAHVITNMQREFPSLVVHAVIFRYPDSPQLREIVRVASNGHFHASINGVELQETFCAIGSSLEYTGNR